MRARGGWPFDGVLLLAFGGPQGPDEIRPFLDNVLRGRAVAPGRIEEVVRHYAVFEGVSPLPAITQRQAAALTDHLQRAGLSLPVFVGMRNWQPFVADTMREMRDAGVRRAIGFILAPHRSYSSCRQYRQNVDDARALLRASGRSVDVIYVGDWYAHPLFVQANAKHVRQAAERLLTNGAARLRAVFTAHSIPTAWPGASEYARQVRTSARLVAQAAGIGDWAVAYQSRSGRPDDPWLEPDIGAYLRTTRHQVEAVVISPIGFVADHIEVLYDLDHEVGAICADLRLPMARAATVNDDPLFMEMMAEVVGATMARYAGGRPLVIVE